MSEHEFDPARHRIAEVAAEPFTYLVQTMSAYDAWAKITDAARDESVPMPEFQLAKAYGDVHNEVGFHQDAAEPGDPVSPVISKIELSPSNFYVTVRFLGTPVYLTLPAMSTITIGWLRQNV